ncbi:MAG: sugar ABC transporter substrate-binding protein [Roseitalea sp.]|jgi:simple sugar transport system substrate-binding protein|nr:sugar ABC transporter substrate-binding protein [Roseitalea sp.]MBO6721143.1 sugar ABC transporter substrate-binding protein [Roseitalea sp.]MBO6744201.1 sugar ABC transporter substrate-binding protein [Roseitalea sp.]
MARKLKFYAVTHDILGDVFWEVFRKGLTDAAGRFDVDVEHLRPGKFSPEIQAGLIDGAVHARPDGLISTIPNVDAVEPSLCRAVEAGIPLIAINAADPRPKNERIPYLFYIGGDDTHAGVLAGRHVIGAVSPKRGLCVDHYMHDHICHSDRYRGFEKAFGDAGLPVERLRVPGGDAAACETAVFDHLKAHPEVDTVLTLGPPGAEAVLGATRLLEPEKRPAHITFDIAQLQIDGIRSGEILATVDSQQYLQGFFSVQTMWMHVAMGFTMADDIFTGPVVVDAHNLDKAAEGVRAGIR